MRRQFHQGIICAIGLLTAQLISVPSLPVNATDATRKPAPTFTLSDSKGVPVSLANYKGKVVLLNFWATWCHGCVQEMPWFIEFQDKYRSNGLAVIGLSMDEDGWKAVTPFVKEKKVNYPVFIANQNLADQFGLAAMPMTLLIDRDGNIATKYEGVVDREACEKQIRSLLEERAKNSAD